ncbi:hypothetical protein OIV83_000097 [Microbotryomycetes sp. JL201]|nr:hypothetical protein OIV83_000097 [Microbotryomycetes sp. JL201]
MPPPPPTFPLPPKPVSAASHHSHRGPAPQQAYQPVPNRSAYLSTSQPSSPRLPTTPYGSAGTTSPPPRPSLRSVPQPGAHNLAQGINDARSKLRRALNSDDLVSSVDILDLGLGWKVYWRAWRGPALLTTSPPPMDGSAASTLSTQLKPDSSTTRYGTTHSRASSPNPLTSADSSKAQTRHSVDAAIDAGADATAQPVASTSKHAPMSLKDKTLSLSQVAIDSDPVEQAQRKIASLAQSTSSPLSLFSFVKVSALKTPVNDSTTDKGKGKAVEDEDSARRILWVFSLRRGSTTEPDNTSRSALSALEFPGLTGIGKGHFSHRELFPEVYVASEQARPDSLLEGETSSVPSVCSISSELHADPASSSTTPAGKFKAPFEAFIAALTSSIAGILLAAENELGRGIRFGSDLLYLPDTSARPKAAADGAFAVSLRLSLLSDGVLIQPKVVAKPYCAVDVAKTFAPTTRLLLAPHGLPAELVKVFASETCQASVNLSTLRSTWSQLLEGLGLKLRLNEDWILCRIHLPSCTAPIKPVLSPLPLPAYGSSPEVLELLWPASLCVIDGTAIQPTSSPDSSPKRMRPTDLVGLGPASPAASLLITRPRSNTNPALNSPRPPPESQRKGSADLIPALRAARRAFASSTFSDPLVAQADKVASILEHLNEERERREKLEKDAEALLKAQPAPPPTPISSDLGRPTPLPNVPVNMRTPISLGGATTEASSPADGFVGADKALLASLGYGSASGAAASAGATVPVGSAEQLYPSPDELNTAAYQTATEVSMPFAAPVASAPVDNTFSDFDWGDDFSGTMNRGMRSTTNQEFDDGMMMGLTDDDFSFFDEPAPLPVSLPMPTTSFDATAGIQSTDPSPRFVDHFSHLGGPQGFASAASPSSPFAHASPLAHTSPGLQGLNFTFDSQNMLGLGNTPTAIQHDLISHKTPRTPFSPFVELTDEQQSPAFSVPSVSVAGTPAHAPSSSSRPIHQFEAINFGKSHAALDDKYNARKGKFALPSPESDNDTLPMPVDLVLRKPSRRSSVSNSLVFSAMCDPRVSTALMLKRRKLRHKTESTGKRHLIPQRGKLWQQPRMRTWVSQDTLSETDGDDSDDDVMDGIESSSFGGAEEDFSSEGMQGDGTIAYTFGAALLLLHGHLVPLLAGKTSETDSSNVSKLIALEAQLEQSIDVFSEQFLLNPDFRQDYLQSSMKHVNPPSVSARAVSSFHKALQSFTSKFRPTPSVPAQIFPKLSPCDRPKLLLRSQQSMVQLATSAFEFWRPMSFQPLSGEKDVTAFAVYEDAGSDLGEAVSQWLTRVGETYQSLRLGSHEPGVLKQSSTFAGLKPGVCVVARGTMLDAKNKDEWRGFSSHLIESARQRKHVVLYLLMPQEEASLSATSSIVFAIQQIAKARQSSLSLLVYPVPVASVIGWRSIGNVDRPCKRLERLAFAVYDQLLISVPSLAFPVPETFPAGNMMRPQSVGPASRSFQGPAIWMSQTASPRISFSFKWPPPSLEIMHRGHLMHVAYTWISGHTANSHWVILSCIDERGEIWKTLPRLLRINGDTPPELAVARHVWDITRMLSVTADVDYRFVICRVGIPSRLEVKVFEALLKDVLPHHKRPLHVSLVAIELDAPLAVVKRHEPQPSSVALATNVVQPIQEDGEVMSSTPTEQSPSSNQPTFVRVVPNEPVAIGSHSNLIAPASAFLVHVPQNASLSHLDRAEPFMSSSDSAMSMSPTSNAISVFGLHFLSFRRSPSSQTNTLLKDLVKQVSQSFVELAALGQTRWSASGRLPWHVEAVQAIVNLVESVGRDAKP